VALQALLELPEETAHRLKALAMGVDTTFDFMVATQEYEDLKPLLARFGEEKLCSQRVHEACRVIDELLAPAPEGGPPEMWQMAKREIPAGWPPQAAMMLKLCARVVELALELTAKCSRAERVAASEDDEAEGSLADVHAANLLFPLLTNCLHAVSKRSPDTRKHPSSNALQQARTLSNALQQARTLSSDTLQRVLGKRVFHSNCRFGGVLADVCCPVRACASAVVQRASLEVAKARRVARCVACVGLPHERVAAVATAAAHRARQRRSQVQARAACPRPAGDAPRRPKQPA
jgi:hypothetical protein